jgi:hypothetical protein
VHHYRGPGVSRRGAGHPRKQDISMYDNLVVMKFSNLQATFRKSKRSIPAVHSSRSFGIARVGQHKYLRLRTAREFYATLSSRRSSTTGFVQGICESPSSLTLSHTRNRICRGPNLGEWLLPGFNPTYEAQFDASDGVAMQAAVSSVYSPGCSCR